MLASGDEVVCKKDNIIMLISRFLDFGPKTVMHHDDIPGPLGIP